MIRADGLTKFYEQRCVVKELSFSIADREIVGFLGLNGAGKTTALRMLAGLLAPSAGRISIDGEDLWRDPRSLRWRIGFLPERPPLYDDMTVRSYLAFTARLRGLEEDRVTNQVDAIIRRTALEAYADHLIGKLSHGYRQRLGIAQAVVHDPALVILDEPINGLDPVQIVEMRGLIRALKEHHTVLISSHILPEISQTCDRFLILHQGALVGEGTEAELSGRAGAQRLVRVEVSGARAESEPKLAALPSVTEVRVLSDAQGLVTADLVLAADDLEEVARALIASGLGMRRFEPRRSELEQMFLRLTGGTPS